MLENTTSNIILGVRMGFTLLDISNHHKTLMIFKYDKFNNIVFWQDLNGG